MDMDNNYLDIVAKGALADLQQHRDNVDGFTLSKFSDSEVKVYTKKSDVVECPEDIVKATVTLANVNTAQVLALCLPWFPYRTQWDDVLVEAKIIEDISPSTKLINHICKKKMPLSARDSLDVVSVQCRNEEIFIASRSVTHNDVPEVKERVRTITHLGGYVIKPIEGGKVEFEMYFHADLKISGITLIKSIVESIKPKFMVDLCKALRKATEKVAVSPVDMENTRIHTDLQIEC